MDGKGCELKEDRDVKALLPACIVSSVIYSYILTKL